MAPSPAKVYDCVIIGGGPAGLSTAYRFVQRGGMDFTVLERGRIGHSWHLMHDSLLLLSPMWVNQLPGHRFPLHRSFSKIPKADFIGYLQSYAKRYEMPWRADTDVYDVAVDDGNFVLNTSAGPIRSRSVVNATGYYGSPHMPDFTSDDGSVRVMHAADYRSPEQVASLTGPTGRILIVGKRVSAGQLLEELDDAGFTLGISVRGPIETRPGGLRGIIKENLYYVKEMLRFRIDPYIRQNSLALMNGGKTDRIIRSGRLQQHPTIDRIEAGEIHFADSSRACYDLVICATGFDTDYPHLRGLLDDDKPVLEQLQMGAHQTVPGLFFVGVDNLINFKSRYVRGVAADSALVAARVANFLRSGDQ